MKISSSAFKESDKIPILYTGESANVSPPIKIEFIPDKAKSLVLICEDPNSIGDKAWVHWILFNIPFQDNELEIKENSYLGVRGLNDFKKLPYGGPIPPRGSGTHRYYFKIFALDCELDLDEGVTLEKIKVKMEKHILDKAEFYGNYWRN